MARQLNRLSARTVATAKKPGRHADGGGLYLVVDKSGAKRWVFLFRFGGPHKEMGLGGLTRVSLVEARRLAEWCRSTLAKGENPIEARKAAGRVPTFGECANEYVASMAGHWRNEQHRAQWGMTLTRYTETIRSMPVNMIGTAEVLRVLQPIWQKIPETASRLRGRIERVLDAAQARGFRSGENPARWKGHLSTLLPPRQKLTRGHHAAMPYQELPAFLGRLRARDGVSARALEFVILTAARSGEVLGLQWNEIDLERKVWTVPATRIKAGREHRVPLSPRAVAIIEAMQTVRVSDYVFPGYRPGRPLGDMALHLVRERMEIPHTVHGFRSTFRDWCGEATNFPREVAGAALAHVVGDETERAYRRGDALEKRRKLMEAWASYCEPKACNVVVLA
ncbi:MAG TPA: integrase arm-type DNA-binding domain-containing protein [Aestuariivirgaceae bacterium]|jgi:integrase|nr:integrase arm-type DNA-binding domain-containing protein [Aestuariivirgaceae bacterium]